MKKFLLITYYWPPSGGAGVQRCLKLVKYARDFGWEPVVYTALDAAYPITDPSLEQDVPPEVEVIRGPIWEPYEWYKRFTGKKKDEAVYSGFLNEDKKPSLTERLSIWVRGNFFIPDARRFWIGPSVKLLADYLKQHPVDAIISSGPPHSVHLIARGLKRQLGIPWVADFRDPWTNIDFYDQLGLSSWADRIHHRQEASVMREADQIVTVSWTWAKEFEALGAKAVPVITNGFDEADFAFEKPPLETKFVFSHIGYLNADRNPPLLWQAFGELCREIPGLQDDLVLRFIGKTDHITYRQIEAQGLADNLERIAYLPHSEVLSWTCRSQALLLLVNDVPNVMGHIPGKTYEYIGSRRPVLAIGPEEADFARVIRETNSGVVCGFTDLEKMKREILRMYRQWKKGELSTGDATGVSRYSRRTATGGMMEVLGGLK
ncbi:MAG: glycosyl transferase family 1 [Bacteroidetes bacterium]|nr:MAG: glycosyl transferase family 1 [Bacteroidota bacterium]